MSTVGRRAWVVMWGLFGGLWWLGVGIAGWMMWRLFPSPLNLAVGLPVALLSWGFMVSAMWDIFLAAFSRKF